MKRALVLDWGGILIEDPALPLANGVAQALDLNPKEREIFDQIWPTQLAPVALGHRSEVSAWRILEQKFGRSSGFLPADLWAQLVREHFAYRSKVWDLLPLFKAVHWQLGLFSNTEPSAIASLRAQERIEIFDHQWISCEIGLSKPDPQFYHRVQADLDCVPVFLDDRPENVAVALDLGWDAHCLKDEEAICTRLQSLIT